MVFVYPYSALFGQLQLRGNGQTQLNVFNEGLRFPDAEYLFLYFFMFDSVFSPHENERYFISDKTQINNG